MCALHRVDLFIDMLKRISLYVDNEILVEEKSNDFLTAPPPTFTYNVLNYFKVHLFLIINIYVMSKPFYVFFMLWKISTGP